GVKPLYWWHRDGLLAFASEVKALLVHPRIRAEVCVDALDEYFTFQNVLSDLTLFDGVKLLPPGHTLTVEQNGEPRLVPFWDFQADIDSALTGDEAGGAVHEALRR